MMRPSGGRVRIVGGRYRGRKLPVPGQAGLRPTPDRVRETLFNWLEPLIEGARCLDLFAGSGALGFESASRGAREVVLVESSESVARVLATNAQALGADRVQVVRADALLWLSAGGRPFDIVFLDPPFAAGLLAPACDLLARNGWLAAPARIYLEAPAELGFPPLPVDWCLLRDKQAGQVRYGLALSGGESGQADRPLCYASPN